MELKRRLFTAGSTLLVAAAVGHLVQNSDAYFGDDAVSKQGVIKTSAASVTPPLPVLSAKAEVTTPVTASPVSFQVPTDPPENVHVAPAMDAQVPARVDETFTVVTPDPLQLNEYGLECVSDLALTVLPAGMVELDVTASCKPNMQVVITHEGLSVSEKIDATGRLKVEIPALVRTGGYVVAFGDGTELSESAIVPEAENFQRVALMWRDKNAMQLHVYEFGAGHGSRGHIWAEQPGVALPITEAKHGFLTQLGNQGVPGARLAEVYSFPTSSHQDPGVIRVNVQAEVTAENCGRQIQAETLQESFGGRMQTASLTLYVPQCDAVGEFLVLKNLLRDMKIAQN